MTDLNALAERLEKWADEEEADSKRGYVTFVGVDDLRQAAQALRGMGDAFAWASEWTGIGGVSRALHLTEADAIENAVWMEGRHFPLFARSALKGGGSE